MADEVSQADVELEEAVEKGEKKRVSYTRIPGEGEAESHPTYHPRGPAPKHDRVAETVEAAKETAGEAVEVGKKATEAGKKVAGETYEKAAKTAHETYEGAKETAEKTKTFIEEKQAEGKVRAKERRAEKMAQLQERSAELKAQREVASYEAQVRKMSGGSAIDRMRGRGAGGELSPFARAMQGKGKQEIPLWMRGGSSESSFMQNALHGTQGGYGRQPVREQRSAFMDAAMGTGYGYQPKPKTRQKVIMVNGKAYVSREPVQQAQTPQNQSMLASALFSRPERPRETRVREPERQSPLMQAALSGGRSEQHESPLAKVMFSGPSYHQGKQERRSPLQSAMEGSVSSHGSKEHDSPLMGAMKGKGRVKFF